jgi:hypothetical protein
LGDDTLEWDDERTSRAAIVEALGRAGFREVELAAG